jgi:hypothetical protein
MWRSYGVSFGDLWSVTEGQVTSYGAWCNTGHPHKVLQTFDVMRAMHYFDEDE